MVDGTQMSVPKRFAMLRFVGIALKVVAWVVLVLSLLIAVAVSVAGNAALPFMDQVGSALNLIGVRIGFLVGFGLFLTGLLEFVVLFAVGDGILMRLSIEENTRLTAALLLKMDQDNQHDTTSSSYASSYQGGYYQGPS